VLRHELIDALPIDGAEPPPAAQHAAAQILQAEKSILEPATPLAWWQGSQQESVWQALHEADASIIQVLALTDKPGELSAHAQDVLQKAQETLGESDPRLIGARSRLKTKGTSTLTVAKEAVPLLVHLARDTYAESDARYAQSRGFRNRLIRLTVVAAACGLAVLVAAAMGQIDLGVPGVAAHGWRAPTLIVLFGAIGAAISAIPPLASAQGVRNPFNLPMYQLALKMALGPLFAFVGVLLLQGNVIKDLSPVSTLLDLLVWSTLFGAGQQAVTRLVDQRVNGMLSGTTPAPKRSAKGEARTAQPAHGHGATATASVTATP
jgi:hypothetical protein